MKTRLIVFLVILAMLVFALPAFSQTEVPSGTSPAEGELAAALELLISAVSKIILVPVAAPFVVVAVALLKRYIPVNPAYLALIVQVIVWVAWIIALNYGYSDQFGSWINSLTTILTGVSGLALSSVAATKLYNSSVKNDVPLLGNEGNAANQPKG